MAKSFTTNLQAEHEKNVTTLTGCLKIVRKDATEYTYTSHDRDIIVNMGEAWDGTYLATYAFTPSSFTFTSDLAVDNFDITNVIDNIIVTEIDIINDLFNSAEVWYFTCNHSTSTGEITATDGINKVFHGYISTIEYTDKKYLAEVRSLSTKFTKEIGNVYSKTCRTTLGTAKCGIVLDPSVWTFNTAYEVGDFVKASTYDGRRYECTTAGTSNSADTEPTWDTIIDNTTNEEGDGTCVWTTRDSYTKEFTVQEYGVYGRYFRFTIDDQTNHGYYGQLNEFEVRDADNVNHALNNLHADSGDRDGYTAEKAVDGSTATTSYWRTKDTGMPEWITIDAGQNIIVKDYRIRTTTQSLSNPRDWTVEVSQNDVDYDIFYTINDQSLSSSTWYTYTPQTNPNLLPNGISTGNTFSVTTPDLINYADDFFKHGILIWLTGNNAGIKQEVKRSIQSTGTIEFYLPTNFEIMLGDTFEVKVGCNRMYLGSDGTAATGDCKTKYNNLINFRGEPFIPSEDVLIGGSGIIDKE